MKYLIEHYGTGFLSGAAAVLLVSMFLNMLRPGGMLSGIAAAFLEGLG